MDIGAILVGTALLVAVVVYVARPLFEKAPREERGLATNGNSHAQLTTRRDAIYALIRELDRDYQTGAINSEDYQALRNKYVSSAVPVLKQLDALSSQDGRGAVEAEIEAQVLALRQVPTRPQAADQPSATRFCTQCGQPADLKDRFCANCGASLKETASQ